MTKEQAIETLSIELRHTESHMRIEGKASEYYEELSQIAEALRMAIEALNNEPKKGEWIKKIDHVGFVSYICSECGDELELEDCSDSYYCANCGAKMREADTEQYITKEDYKYNKKKHRWEPNND